MPNVDLKRKIFHLISLKVLWYYFLPILKKQNAKTDAVQKNMEILIGMCLDSVSNTQDILINESKEMKLILPWANKNLYIDFDCTSKFAVNDDLLKIRSSIGDNRLDFLMILSVKKM